MTVLLADARSQLLSEEGDILSKDIPIHELLYADDTLLVDVSSSCLQKYMNIIRELGSHYGLELNWKKVESLPVRSDISLTSPDGVAISAHDSIIYLGALLTSDGKIDSELGRRIGMAHVDFKAL